MAHALIFDSGVGGLSVSAEIRKILPTLRQSYVADDAFRPYGEKSEAALRARLPRLLAELEIMLCPDIIVIACNTASTTALAGIRAAVSAPVIGVVPAIKPAAAMTKSGAIGVLGTPATVRQKYVGGLILEFASEIRVALQGSVDLVEIAEAKLAGKTVDTARLKSEIKPLFTDAGDDGDIIDTVVLACTHFPLLRDELAAAAPHKVKWIDSGEAIARRVKSILEKQEADAGRKPAERKLSGEQKSSDNDIAFLIGGPEMSAARRAAFERFGFKRVVGLWPDN